MVPAAGGGKDILVQLFAMWKTVLYMTLIALCLA